MAPFFDHDPTKVWTPREVLAVSFAQPLDFAPGTAYEYSNTNYALLGLIVQKVDHRPLAVAMEKRLFGPLPGGTPSSPEHLEQDPQAVCARLPVRQLLRGDDRHPEPAVHPGIPSRDQGRQGEAQGLHRREPLLRHRGRGRHLH